MRSSYQGSPVGVRGGNERAQKENLTFALLRVSSRTSWADAQDEGASEEGDSGLREDWT